MEENALLGGGYLNKEKEEAETEDTGTEDTGTEDTGIEDTGIEDIEDIDAGNEEEVPEDNFDTDDTVFYVDPSEQTE